MSRKWLSARKIIEATEFKRKNSSCFVPVVTVKYRLLFLLLYLKNSGKFSRCTAKKLTETDFSAIILAI